MCAKMVVVGERGRGGEVQVMCGALQASAAALAARVDPGAISYTLFNGRELQLGGPLG